MSEPLRVGLVGCGGMGNEHLKIIDRIPGAQLIGVCDYREPRAHRMSVQHEVPFWLDFAQFLDEAKPQAVHICSPSGLHAEHGIAAAARGIHVLCEKPLDIDIAKVDRLIAACDANDVRLGCIFQRRMSRGAQIVREAIAEGRMGRLLSCSASVKWWRSQVYYDKDDWRGTWALDGGALSNQGIHSLDQMVWMAGPVAEVEYAHLETANHRIEAEDFALVVVRFENGARGTIEVTTCCSPDLATRLEVYGTNGSVALDDAKVVRFGLDGKDLLDTLEDKGSLTGGGSDPWAISLGGHEMQIKDFYQAIAEHRAPMVDGREGRLAVDLLTKIYARAFPDQKLGT
jgi:UDP-N-acetyl-2-amino-2-deoxyglucuronate dehydrogenase